MQNILTHIISYKAYHKPNIMFHFMDKTLRVKTLICPVIHRRNVSSKLTRILPTKPETWLLFTTVGWNRKYNPLPLAVLATCFQKLIKWLTKITTKFTFNSTLKNYVMWIFEVARYLNWLEHSADEKLFGFFRCRNNLCKLFHMWTFIIILNMFIYVLQYSVLDILVTDGRRVRMVSPNFHV